MSGLLVDGLEIAVQGLRILNRNDDARAKLDSRDGRKRRASFVNKLGLHTTKGIDPQHVIPGKGETGRAFAVAAFWHRDPLHSGAHLVVDGHEVLCLADLAWTCAYHATTANEASIGIEMVQEASGGIHEATLANTVRLVEAICGLASHPRAGKVICVPFQIPADAYRRGHIIERLKHGGADYAGIFGHRDQAWMFPEHLDENQRAKYPHGYAGRGRGDPGDLIMERLVEAGAERFMLAEREDVRAWKRRQERLVSWGARLTVDGLYGPATQRAMVQLGFASGREIDAACEDPRG